MIELIDIEENIGTSRYQINANLDELDALVCNLHDTNDKQQFLLNLFTTSSAAWIQTTELVQELSAKWDNFANTVFTLSGYWQGPITLIKSTPFLNGTVNSNKLKTYLDSNFPAKNYPANQVFQFAYLVQNFDPKVSQENIFNLETGMYCFRDVNNVWTITKCGESGICFDYLDCDDLFKPISLPDAYACGQKFYEMYFLINPDD